MSSGNIYDFRSDDDFHLYYDVSTQPLGAGGFGTVFPATRKIDGQKVAIKRAPLWMIPSIWQTSADNTPVIPNELQLLHRAQSCPGVIRLYDSWRDEADLVLAMEYNENATDLLNHMEVNGVLEEAEAANILRQVVRTLQSCQEKNIFHRDVKLENILYDKTTGETKLIDFGCGELTTSPNQTFKEYKGTLEYVPPELYINDAYSAEPSTVWSIGCIAFMMIFGYKPFYTKEDIIFHRIKMERGIGSMRVRKFILKCLSPLPAERPSLESLLAHAFLAQNLPVISEVPSEPKEEETTPFTKRRWRTERDFPELNGQQSIHPQSQPQQNGIPEPIEKTPVFTFSKPPCPQLEEKENKAVPSNSKAPATTDLQIDSLLKQVCGEVDGAFRYMRNPLTSQPQSISTSRKRPFQQSLVCHKVPQNKIIRKC